MDGTRVVEDQVAFSRFWMKSHSRNTFHLGAALLLWVLPTNVAFATTIDMRPYQAVVLNDGVHCIVHDSHSSLAMYRVADATLVHRFNSSKRIAAYTLSPDQAHLLVAVSEGQFHVWDVSTGALVRKLTQRDTGLLTANVVGYSGNGRRFAVSSYDRIVAFDRQTGIRIASVSFPPGSSHVNSFALDADGSGGFLIDNGQMLQRFDFATGSITSTGMGGAWPIRGSFDGKRYAFRSSNSGSQEQLSVVTTGEKLSRAEYGDFAYIGSISPQIDGTFLVTGRMGRKFSSDSAFIGVRIGVGDEPIEKVWEHAYESGVNERTDYSAKSMIGVSTDFALRTKITDLRAGKPLAEIDNSANYQVNYASYFHRGIDPRIVCGGVVWAVVSIVAVLWWRRRRRRRSGGTERPQPPNA
jgi:WD40 repeat protein